MRCGDFKESYREDEEIFQSLFVRICLAVLFRFPHHHTFVRKLLCSVHHAI